MALVLGTNCGFVTAAPVADPTGNAKEFDNWAAALKDVSPATATKITEIGIWINNATEEANLDLAIYTHNIGDDNPEAIVTGKINIAKGTTAGWKKQSCDITISPETDYWIAAQLDNTATATQINYGDDAGEKWDYKLSETELTDPWGVSDGTYDDKLLGVYAVWAAGGEVKELAGTSVISSATTGELTKAAIKELVGTCAIESTTSGVLRFANWIGIDNTHYESACGAEGLHTLERALVGSDYWAHYVTHTHSGIINLGHVYNVTKVRARSNGGYDPTDVNIYVSVDGETWGAAVASGITTWQDRTDWDGTAVIDTTPKNGQFVKIEIIDTENVDDHLTFGATEPFSIFDVFGEKLPVELVGVSEISSTTSGELKAAKKLVGTAVIESTTTGAIKPTRELAGTCVIESTTAGELSISGILELAGTCVIESAATGIIKLTRKLAGTCVIESTTAGELTKTGLKMLAGVAEIGSTTSGVLSLTIKLAGISVIESTTAGELSVTVIIELAGVVAIVSTTAGELIVTGIKELAGVSVIKSTATGLLITPYTEIPPLMEKDLIDPYASGAWLWLVQIAVPTKDTVHIARNTEDVHYDGNDFDKFNLQIGGQTFSGDGSIPRVTLRTFQDSTRQIENIINETEGALGGAVKLIRVNQKWLTSPVSALEADYDLLASQSDSEWCTFTLGIPNLLTQRYPLEDFSSSICPWTSPELYKGPECQCVHADTTCTGTYADCLSKGNETRWGGELGLSPSVVKEHK